MLGNGCAQLDGRCASRPIAGSPCSGCRSISSACKSSASAIVFGPQLRAQLTKSVPKHVGVGRYENVCCTSVFGSVNERRLLPPFNAPLTSNSPSTLKSRTCLTSSALHSLPFAHSLARSCLEPVRFRIKHRKVLAHPPTGRQNHSMRRASALALVLRQLRPCQDTSSAAHRCKHGAWGLGAPSSARPQPRVTRPCLCARRLQQNGAPWLLGGNGFALPAGAAVVERLGRRLVSQQHISLSSAPARAAAASMPAFWHSISPSFAHMLSANRKRLACKLHEFETTLAALVCSLTDTRSGQVRAGVMGMSVCVGMAQRWHIAYTVASSLP